MLVEKAILGTKLGMTQMFGEGGHSVPVTLIEAGPCLVVQRKTTERDGYEAVQLGWGRLPERAKLIRPLLGHFRRAGVAPMRRLREFAVANPERFQSGQEIRADTFQEGERVVVSGVSKGKGFAGVIKRYGFKGGPATHGSMSHRRPASGGATGPQRTLPGARKPGHMGAERVTTPGLLVMRVDAQRNLLALRGAVPGPTGGLVEITVPAKR